MWASWFAVAGAVLALSLTAPTASAQQDDRCQVVRSSGDVRLGRGATEVAAVPGQILARDDRLRTGSDGRATVRCGEGLEMLVGPDTRIVLDRMMGPGDTFPGIGLLEGIAGFLMPRPRRGGFVVRTPSAVAAVRSTEWSIEVEDRATAAFVRQGRVEVATVGRVVLLTAGEGVDVTPRGIAGETKRWGAPRVEGLAGRLGPDW
jgi:ferric-dicitrate binding protein FerR (iron transport regulator)